MAGWRDPAPDPDGQADTPGRTGPDSARNGVLRASEGVGGTSVPGFRSGESERPFGNRIATLHPCLELGRIIGLVSCGPPCHCEQYEQWKAIYVI